MWYLRFLLTLLVIAFATVPVAQAQGPTLDQPCSEPINNDPCVSNLGPGVFTATPLIDANCSNGCPDYGDPDHNKVSLYGNYGNDESIFPTGHPARDHYQKGVDLANQITPLCTDGSTSNPCPDGRPQSIVFLFIGFSNCSIEVCGGNSDIWDGQDTNPNNPNGHLKGQPCATPCRNRNHPSGLPAWNQVTSNGGDTVTQQSFLYQVYHPNPVVLVGPRVVIWDGAMGGQLLNRWDPTTQGYYAHHNNCQWGETHNAECNYERVRQDLERNLFTEKQVQAVFLKSSNGDPTCDLKRTLDNCSLPGMLPDAYESQIYIGNILRYLKCCKLDPYGMPGTFARYPNLKQVFITSRTYGGYANGTDHGCLMPEPFAYEEGIAVQRSIVAQIDRTTTDYVGDVRYPEKTPWFDWGPYLWASGATLNSAGIRWCNGQPDPSPCNGEFDFRYGDLDAGYEQYWGDRTHPTADAAKKVADQLVKFISGQLPQPQLHISDWVLPWKVK